MSSRLARQMLDFLPKEKKKNSEITGQKRQVGTLPKTKRGIKKVKYEIRYGQHQRLKLQRAEALKRENPTDALAKEKQVQEENLARNVKRLTTKLKATETERRLWKKILRPSKDKADKEDDGEDES